MHARVDAPDRATTLEPQGAPPRWARRAPRGPAPSGDRFFIRGWGMHAEQYPHMGVAANPTTTKTLTCHQISRLPMSNGVFCPSSSRRPHTRSTPGPADKRRDPPLPAARPPLGMALAGRQFARKSELLAGCRRALQVYYGRGLMPRGSAFHWHPFFSNVLRMLSQCGMLHTFISS